MNEVDEEDCAERERLPFDRPIGRKRHAEVICVGEGFLGQSSPFLLYHSSLPAAFADLEGPRVKERAEQFEEFGAVDGEHGIDAPKNGKMPFQGSYQRSGAVEDLGRVEVEPERTLDSEQGLAIPTQDVDGKGPIRFEKEASEERSSFLEGIEQFGSALVGDDIFVDAFEPGEDFSPLLLLTHGEAAHGFQPFHGAPSDLKMVRVP